jgi:hypothetical protein
MVVCQRNNTLLGLPVQWENIVIGECKRKTVRAGNYGLKAAVKEF